MAALDEIFRPTGLVERLRSLIAAELPPDPIYFEDCAMFVRYSCTNVAQTFQQEREAAPKGVTLPQKDHSGQGDGGGGVHQPRG